MGSVHPISSAHSTGKGSAGLQTECSRGKSARTKGANLPFDYWAIRGGQARELSDYTAYSKANRSPKYQRAQPHKFADSDPFDSSQGPLLHTDRDPGLLSVYHRSWTLDSRRDAHCEWMRPTIPVITMMWQRATSAGGILEESSDRGVVRSLQVLLLYVPGVGSIGPRPVDTHIWFIVVVVSPCRILYFSPWYGTTWMRQVLSIGYLEGAGYPSLPGFETR
jgi:hypothetical protein